MHTGEGSNRTDKEKGRKIGMDKVFEKAMSSEQKSQHSAISENIGGKQEPVFDKAAVPEVGTIPTGLQGGRKPDQGKNDDGVARGPDRTDHPPDFTCDTWGRVHRGIDTQIFY